MVCVHPPEVAGTAARARPRPRPRFRRLGLRRVAVSVLAATSVALAFGAASRPAAAATPNRAAIVVEVNGVIHTAKVTFSAGSITGLDALRAAGFNPLVRVFGANGGAVCALDVGTMTIGCPADGSCLTCDAPRYWAYFRAPAGATQYTYSIAGAGLTQVRDGDVEAWVWGTGSAPSRFVSFADVWGTDPPPTTRPPATGPPATRPTAPTTAGGPGTVTTGPAPSVLGTSRAPTTAAANRKGGSSTTTAHGTGAGSTVRTTSDGTGTTTDGERKIATAPVVARGRGGSPFGLLAFGAVLAALVVAIVLARRRRSRPPTLDRASG
jgi:hypothetical protein